MIFFRARWARTFTLAVLQHSKCAASIRARTCARTIGSVFGGQVLGQALSAASQTVTAEQKVRVAAIVDRRHQKAREQFSRHREALQVFMAQSFAEIRQELTPPQQVKLDALQAEMEERFRKRGRRFHPPPGH